MHEIEKAPGAQQMGVLCVRCNNTSTQIPGLKTGQWESSGCCCHLCYVGTCGHGTVVTRTLAWTHGAGDGARSPVGGAHPGQCHAPRQPGHGAGGGQGAAGRAGDAGGPGQII